MDRLVDDSDSTAEELGDALYQSSMLIGLAYQCTVSGPLSNVWPHLLTEKATRDPAEPQ